MNNEAINIEPLKARRRFSAREKTDWVNRYVQSGMIQSQFCQQHGLAQSTLQRWVTEHRAQAEGSGATAAQAEQPLFRELSLAATAANPVWVAEVFRPNGTIVRLAQALSVQQLERLLGLC